MENDNLKPKPNKKNILFIIIILILLSALIGVILWFLLFFSCPEVESTTSDSSSSGDSSSSASSTSSSNPCSDGSDNTAPDGYTFYENSDIGFRFAYPTSWGTVSLNTDPASGSETGDYINGSFSGKDNVWFGGNATDYVVGAREGMPTDLPGYLEAGGSFYTVGIWRYTDGSTTESRSGLYPIEPPYEEKTACNTSALKTFWPANELSSVGPADIYRINLQPENQYYGVNFVVNNPEASTTTQIESLVNTFQLIP